MHSDAIKVMIVDDHELIREGISKILDMENDIDIVFKARSGIEALEVLKDVKPDVILLDINMNELNYLLSRSNNVMFFLNLRAFCDY